MALPPIISNQDLANFLDVKKGIIAYYAYYIKPGKAYNNFKIKKRAGGERSIDAPVKGLKDLQKKILDRFSKEINFRKCVYGYVKGRGILQNSEVHIRQRWVLRVDIKDFFPSITKSRVAGMFMAQPFNLGRAPARALALISTKQGELPQGSPLSPWITNTICRGLDFKLQKLAAKYRCYYSRYADDLFFSTSSKAFPAALAYRGENESIITIGDELKAIILDAGFTPNYEKTSLKSTSQRQVVTGVVVNARTNIPKEYVKKVRAALYSWEKFGLPAAEEFWRKNVDTRNRWEEASPRFKLVIRGQINFIRHIKGEADPVYLRLAERLKKLDDTFSFDAKASALSVTEEVHVYVEGQTDRKHLEKAFQKLQKDGLFDDLTLTFPHQKEYGSSNLKSLCKLLSANPQRCLTLCIFDRDEPQVIKEMGGSSADYMDHNNNVFSLIIPTPEYRKGEDICIEHLYTDEHLYLADKAGRRLYSKNEFDRNSCHKSEPDVFIRTPPKSLICDSSVINIKTKESIALSKNDFASQIYEESPPFNEVSFDGFKLLFNKIQEIKNLFKK